MNAIWRDFTNIHRIEYPTRITKSISHHCHLRSRKFLIDSAWFWLEAAKIFDESNIINKLFMISFLSLFEWSKSRIINKQSLLESNECYQKYWCCLGKADVEYTMILCMLIYCNSSIYGNIHTLQVYTTNNHSKAKSQNSISLDASRRFAESTPPQYNLSHI